MDIKIQSDTASIIGLNPVCFTSAMEMVDPTKNSVTTNNRFESNTILLVIMVGSTS